MSIPLPEEQNVGILPPKVLKIAPRKDLNPRLSMKSISFSGIKRSYRC